MNYNQSTWYTFVSIVKYQNAIFLKSASFVSIKHIPILSYPDDKDGLARGVGKVKVIT